MKKLKPHLMLISTALIGGFTYSISKMVMAEHVKPMAVVMLRGMIAALFFTIFHALFIKEKIQKEDYGKILLMGLLGGVINQICFYNGLALTKPINASLMMTMIPLAVMLISTLKGIERFTLLKGGGLLLGMAGVVLLLLTSGNRNFESLFIGDVLILINAISWAGYLVVIKPLLLKYHPITLVKWVFVIGMVFIVPLGFQDFQKTEWAQLPLELWSGLFFIILFATIISFFLNTAVMKYVNPSVAGSYIYLQPILASLIAILWGMDRFSMDKLVYLMCILSGVYLVSLKK